MYDKSQCQARILTYNETLVSDQSAAHNHRVQEQAESYDKEGGDNDDDEDSDDNEDDDEDEESDDEEQEEEEDDDDEEYDDDDDEPRMTRLKPGAYYCYPKIVHV